MDDSREMLSYRTAVVGILVGFVFTVRLAEPGRNGPADGHPAGGDAVRILYIGVARIIAESGLLYVQGPMTAQSFSVYLLGAKAVSPSSLTTLLFSYPIHANSTLADVARGQGGRTGPGPRKASVLGGGPVVSWRRPWS